MAKVVPKVCCRESPQLFSTQRGREDVVAVELVLPAESTMRLNSVAGRKVRLVSFQ